MNKEFLQEYLDQEIQHCQEAFANTADTDEDAKSKLRKLYGARPDTQIVYCESGGMGNLYNFPLDTTLVLPVFPYRTPEHLEAHLGNKDALLREILETRRVIPVVQHPLYYEATMQHPFSRGARAPCYFVRGQYAYSVLLGEEPVLVYNDAGIPT